MSDLQYELQACAEVESDDGSFEVIAVSHADAKFWGVYRRDLAQDPPLAEHLQDFPSASAARGYLRAVHGCTDPIDTSYEEDTA